MKKFLTVLFAGGLLLLIGISTAQSHSFWAKYKEHIVPPDVNVPEAYITEDGYLDCCGCHGRISNIPALMCNDNNDSKNGTALSGPLDVPIPPGLSKIVFIHYKKGFGKPSWVGGTKEKELECYDFLGRWFKWKGLPVKLVINPTDSGLSGGDITFAIEEAALEWDFHTGSELYAEYEVYESAAVDFDEPDGENELVFGNYPENNVIAVTVVWGVFAGPPDMREIFEFDILFDTDFTWGDATANATLMDLQNIATHEIGHGFGLGDLYNRDCETETMYGYSDYGETEKRDLSEGDITGIQERYGDVTVP